MISVHRTTAEWVHQNFEVAKEIDASMEVWKVLDENELALVAGFLVPSLIGFGDLWIIPRRITLRILRARVGLMDLARERFSHISAHVEGTRNARFAEFFGFHAVRPTTIGGKALTRMELWPPHSQSQQ